ncbi:hypothetical protein [Paraburkholderia sp.]|nr:hypothetical protein [Paraburkholderia sp.]MDE1182364.1 hypothetical protein [Paraburkholderia sp.]
MLAAFLDTMGALALLASVSVKLSALVREAKSAETNRVESLKRKA